MEWHRTRLSTTEGSRGVTLKLIGPAYTYRIPPYEKYFIRWYTLTHTRGTRWYTLVLMTNTTLVVAEITFKVAVITSSVANITFVVAEITFKVAVVTSSVAKITTVVVEITFKVAMITFSEAKIIFVVTKITFNVPWL